MPAPPFTLFYTPEFKTVLTRIQQDDPVKYRKILKTLKLLRDVGPSYPSLQSHGYTSFTGPDGENVWESYVENRTPSAWRVFWCYAADATDTIVMVSAGPHP
ncbi:MAG: hypothetical protein LBK28_04990 [Propionibacteriaceae bacterium]|nr:hypothetical protein [Propionibacteriaceae bacterium]